MDTTTLTVLVLALAVALAAGCCLGAGGALLWVRRRDPDGDAVSMALQHRAAESALVKDGLTRLQDQLRELHDQRVGWQSQLHSQVDAVRHATDLLFAPCSRDSPRRAPC